MWLNSYGEYVCMRHQLTILRFFFPFVSSSFFFLFLSKVQLIHREDWLEFYRFKLFAVCYQFSSLCGRFSSPRKSASEKLKGILFSCAFFPSISKTIYPSFIHCTYVKTTFAIRNIEFGNLNVNSFFFGVCVLTSCSFRIAFDSFFFLFFPNVIPRVI